MEEKYFLFVTYMKELSKLSLFIPLSSGSETIRLNRDKNAISLVCGNLISQFTAI
jgi:hypothetical protein